MAVLTLKTNRLSGLALGTALALAPPALAADVSVKLDAGTGFAIKNSTGAVERLRVDEATGNVSRNGALFVHTTGTNNVFVGPGAGNTGTTGYGQNTALGNSSLLSNTTGHHNSGVGQEALRSNTTGTYNSAFGQGALRGNTTGASNSAFGVSALVHNTAGSYNSAFGQGALYSNTTGYGNSAVGRAALAANTTASYNSAFGQGALSSNTTGATNSAFGVSALLHNTTASNNSAFGQGALYSNTGGSSNTAVGQAALAVNTTGPSNSALGRNALRNNTTGSSNTAVGSHALYLNTTGFNNVAIGSFAGSSQTTGHDNIYIVAGGLSGESGQIKIGSVFHTRTTIAGIRGVTTATADAIPVLIDSNGQLGTVSSSRSVKKDIRDMGDATARLLDLRPVTFRYKQEQTLPSGGEVPPEYGLIAEEVAEVFPDLVVYDEKGQPFTVKYHEMAPMLLNEMKKERRAHAQEMAVLTQRLARLEQQVSEASR